MDDKAVVRHERFGELADKINTDNPNAEDVKELRKLFTSNPQLYYERINMSQVAVDGIIEKVGGTALVKESLKMNVKSLREEFNYKDATPMEKLLIEQIVLCWMRMSIIENIYTNNVMGEGSFNLNTAQYWERILSSVQNRYLRAIETLARIKKIIQTTLQVNIATRGGKQVNIAR